MAGKPLTTEAVALTEKKMDMALDDIIKMSKNPTPKNNKQRVPNKNQKVFNGGGVQKNTAKVRQYMDSRSSLRQGFLAQRRSNHQGNHNHHGNHFPVATEVARKAAIAPMQNRPHMNNRIYKRKPNWVEAAPVQRKGAESGFTGKQQSHQAKVMPKQKPQTMDALFANMKEQRMKISSGQNSAQWGGNAQQKLQRGRNRFGN